MAICESNADVADFTVLHATETASQVCAAAHMHRATATGSSFTESLCVGILQSERKMHVYIRWHTGQTPDGTATKRNTR